MMAGPKGRRLLLVGGGNGLVGRHVLAEFGRDWRISSVHRHPSATESSAGVELIRGDVSTLHDWSTVLKGVDLVVNVAWYRAGSLRRFRPLTEGLLRLISAAQAAGTPRFVHVSVPDSPPSLEAHLPYMYCKRRVDRALESSGLSYAIVRPTMLFAPNDKLLTVMLRTMYRYHRFPMFGDGGYHISPLAAVDLARILRVEAERRDNRNVTAGGPRAWKYRDLTDAMFAALGRPPRYFRLSGPGSMRLARLLESLGSSLLYAYEVEWLLSDMLGLPPYDGPVLPLAPVEPFLAKEAARLQGGQESARGYF